MNAENGMIQIVTTPDELNAGIIKGFLESQGIQASYAHNSGRNGRVTNCTVYCISDRAEEALKMLKDQGLLGK